MKAEIYPLVVIACYTLVYADNKFGKKSVPCSDLMWSRSTYYYVIQMSEWEQDNKVQKSNWATNENGPR